MKRQIPDLMSHCENMFHLKYVVPKNASFLGPFCLLPSGQSAALPVNTKKYEKGKLMFHSYFTAGFYQNTRIYNLIIFFKRILV